jgi:cytoskeleton protein RodZ
MTTSHSESATRAPIRGPGAQLAQARADLHLAHEEVAAKLHLATRQIQALEQDDYSSLPGATYVRGYLKSYALLLGLSPEPILEAHTRLTAVPVSPDFRTIAPQKEITSRHHQVRFVTYFMAAIVIGLAIAWWQGRDVRPPNPLLAARDSEPVIAAPEAVPGVDANGETGRPVAALTAPAPADAVATGNKPPVPATPTVAATVNAPVVVPLPTVTVPAPLSKPAGPRIKMVLHADQDSWADIRDARQTKLLYDTVPAGRSITLEGVAPVSIFLGNAAGVRLDYNGQDVDIARYKRGMMARFTLGEEEAAVLPVR